MSTDAPALPAIGSTPAYPDVNTYIFGQGHPRIWEADGWKPESLAWKNGCYLAINLNGPMEVSYSGPGAQEFLGRLSINSVENWPVGRSKHLVMTDDDGLIVTHGLAVRDGEHAFRQLAALPWPAYQAMAGGADGLEVEVAVRDIFILQIAGPTSVRVIERVLGKSIRELAFLENQPIELPGLGVEVQLELSRIGMAGTLAYEIRGAYDAGPTVYDAVYRAGHDLGIQRLGWRTYAVNHTEAGFPQLLFHFQPAAMLDEGYMSSPFAYGLDDSRSGSIDPADIRARLRTPQEVNWAWMARSDHDYVGRAAIEAEAANPKRKTVILRWNPEDVLDTFASHFQPGEEYKYIEFPCAPQSPAGGHADHVTLDGSPVGVSSAAVYSYHYREMISQATVDLEHTEIGTELIVHWGDFGGRIKEIRATVERYPYLDLPSNKDFDLTTVPSGVGEDVPG